MNSAANKERDKRYHRAERYYSSFVWSFTMTDDVAEVKVTADFTDGMLSVHLPKYEKATHKSSEVKVT